MKPKTKLASLLALLPALIAKAWYVVVMCIVIFAVGGVICYGLMKIVTEDLPPDSGATNNAATTSFYRSNTDNNAEQHLSNIEAQQIVGPTNGFVLQYGVSSSDGLPWIAAGTNLVTTITNLSSKMVYCFENDSNLFDFVYSCGGILTRVTLNVGSGNITYTNQNIVIESSTNFEDWTPIFTNSNCQIDWVNTYMDTNAFPKAFYRAAYY